jgi:hypothetical protein
MGRVSLYLAEGIKQTLRPFRDFDSEAVAAASPSGVFLHQSVNTV